MCWKLMLEVLQTETQREREKERELFYNHINLNSIRENFNFLN